MHIAHVVPRGEQPWSGIMTVIIHLAAALRDRGHEVDVWQLHEWSPGAYAEQRRLLEMAGVAQVALQPRRRLGHAAASLADERGIDIVHLHGAFNPSNTAVSRALRRPYVFSPHSGYDPVSLRRSRLKKFAYRLLFERTMLARAALLVALTEVERLQLRDLGAMGPCAVIPNGAEVPPDDLDRDIFRRELGIGPATPLAVFVGRLDVYRKGLDVLVRAISEAPEWQLALVGPRFREVAHLERIIAGLGVVDRIQLVGTRYGRGLQETLIGADLFVLMSRWEGMPMALLEALAMGKPAIVSPAVERLIGVEAEGAGWVADEENLGALFRKLQFDCRDELQRRGRSALLLSRRYDWMGVARQYEVAFERVLASRRG